MPDLSTTLLLLLLGGVVALDGTSVGQFMVSRPLVSGTLAGFLLGDPGTGLLMGCILEAANLGVIPAGGARFLEPGPAALPAVLTALSLGGEGGLAMGAGVGIVMSLIGGEAVVLQRQWNGRILAGISEEEGGQSLVYRFWGCIALDGARGILLTGMGMALALSLPRSLVSHWRFGEASTVALLLLPGVFAAGALLDRWRLTSRRWAIFVVALACGLALGGSP